MKKTLELLKKIYFHEDEWYYVKSLSQDQLDEAIVELQEAMKPKTCEGCKYYSPYRQQECLHEKYCQREYKDYYELKDNV